VQLGRKSLLCSSWPRSEAFPGKGKSGNVNAAAFQPKDRVGKCGRKEVCGRAKTKLMSETGGGALLKSGVGGTIARSKGQRPYGL
jgi:hypothetical protein